MDFSKAFDKVPHRRLLYKLDYYGIRGSTHRWIASWLSGHSQQVVLDGQASDPVPVLSGVPQGSVLGPVLFLVFINDLPDKYQFVCSFICFIWIYALFRIVLSCRMTWTAWHIGKPIGRWNLMSPNVTQWEWPGIFQTSKLSLNIHSTSKNWYRFSPQKYLGITITEDLDWDQHISEITSKATRTLGFLRRNLAFAPRQTKDVAYKTLVRPKLEYASPIRHPYLKTRTRTQQVEKVQRTAARWSCKRWRNTSSIGDMLDELEWLSLEDRRQESFLAFFYKMHSGTVSLVKDKYLTPATGSMQTRAPHNSQYCR